MSLFQIFCQFGHKKGNSVFRMFGKCWVAFLIALNFDLWRLWITFHGRVVECYCVCVLNFIIVWSRNNNLWFEKLLEDGKQGHYRNFQFTQTYNHGFKSVLLRLSKRNLHNHLGKEMLRRPAKHKTRWPVAFHVLKLKEGVRDIWSHVFSGRNIQDRFVT